MQLALSDGEYYVYVVADALRDPLLYVLHGPKLLGLLPEATFRYAEWRGLVEDRSASMESWSKNLQVSNERLQRVDQGVHRMLPFACTMAWVCRSTRSAAET